MHMKLDIDRLGLLLHDATRAVRRRFEQRTQDWGLSSAQWRLLVSLKRDARASQARLAEILEIEPISVSRLVDRMVQTGWVRREPDPNDRRVRLIVPTDKALRAFETVHGVAGEVYAEALAGLSDAQKATLVTALNTIIENLTGEEAACATRPAPNADRP